MKKINQEQINTILKVAVDLNITVKDFENLRKFFEALPALDGKESPQEASQTVAQPVPPVSVESPKIDEIEA